MQERWIFKKAFSNNEGTIPLGTEINFFRGQVFMNGYMVSPAYRKIIENFINDEKLRDEYLEKHRFITNKI